MTPTVRTNVDYLMALADRIDECKGQIPLVIEQQAAEKLRLLRQSETEGWRYADELEQDRKSLQAQCNELREALSKAKQQKLVPVEEITPALIATSATTEQNPLTCTWEQFKRMAKEFREAAPTLNLEQLDNAWKCLGLGYLNMCEPMWATSAKIVLEMEARTFIARELQLTGGKA